MGPDARGGMDRLVDILTADGNLKKLRTDKKIVILLMSCRAGLGFHKALARRLSKKLSIDTTVGGAQCFTFGPPGPARRHTTRFSSVSPARVMGPLVCHEHGTGLFRFQAVC
jgi:hypothetical protein